MRLTRSARLSILESVVLTAAQLPFITEVDLEPKGLAGDPTRASDSMPEQATGMVGYCCSLRPR
jgi:hypothetical protein